MQVDVAKWRQIEHPLGNDATVGDDDDRVRSYRGQPLAEFLVVLDLLRLKDFEAGRLGHLLDRRSDQLHPSPAWPVRLGEYERNLVTGIDERQQCGHSKLRRPAEDQLHGLPLASLLQLADPALDQVALQGADPEDEQNAIQMIDLVLKGPR